MLVVIDVVHYYCLNKVDQIMIMSHPASRPQTILLLTLESSRAGADCRIIFIFFSTEIVVNFEKLSTVVTVISDLDLNS